MSGYPAEGHYDNGYGHGQGQEAYYQDDHNQGYYEGYDNGHQQGGEYYDES